MEEGKTYEAHQLHLTICRLAPRFANVWVNAAWNMAYNISVLKYTPQERWQWVKNGIKLLRDEGIRYNPKSVSLYRELSWIYWHKIGDIMDDEHINYKRALAVEMELVLGAPIVALTHEEYYDWFRRIVDAPRDLEEMISADKEVADLVAHLNEVKLSPDYTLTHFVARNVRPELSTRDLLKEGQDADTLLTGRLKVVTDPDLGAPLDRLLAAVRSKILREDRKFDLDRMLSLMVEQYGPLDWRNAFAHTLYWASLGDEVSRDYANRDFTDAVNTARLVFFSLQSMIMRGRVVLWPDFDDPFASYIDTTPDVRLIPYLYDAYLRLGKEYFGDDPEFVEGTAGPKFMNGFVSGMQTWIELLYLEGGSENLAQAENYFVWLRKNNPHPDGTTQERYLQTLDDYVMGDILDQLWTSKAASGLIGSLIQRGLKQLGLGQVGSGIRSFELAKKSRDYWMKDVKTDISDRRKLPDLPIMVRDEVERFMTKPEISPLFKARLWRRLPLRQRQMTYDRLRPYFEELCAAQNPPWDVDAAFAVPPGMDEFRKQKLELRSRPKEGVETGEKFNR
jgi:hypothetical protein